MSKFYFLIASLVVMMSPIASAQSDPKETNDYLVMRTPPPAKEDSNQSITIHQEIDFSASPQRVYEALLDAKQFAAFSGMPAEINREVGGAFSLFKGHIVGRNVELVPNQRIVQAWLTADWPEGAYSIVRFELLTQGSGTHLVFDHIGFPEGLRDHLAEGWEGHYWSLLKKYFQ
jgi:activator of HSP90 ATPase